MKRHLHKWEGKFKYGGKVHDSLKDFNPKNGEKFELVLLTNKGKNGRNNRE